MIAGQGLLPIRVEQHGWSVIQDGVLLCLYIRGPHRQIAADVGTLYDRWLRIVGAESVSWYRGADDWKEISARQRTRIRKMLTDAGATKPEARIAVKGGGNHDDVMVHGFDYWGRSVPEGSDEASFVELRFSTDWVAHTGVDAFAALAIELAGLVPFSSGYASLAFHEDMTVPGFIDDRAFVHPGMDVHANEYTALYIADLVRGAYWLTFVGPVALERLGGTARLKRSLAPGTEVTELRDGVAIRAGDELRPGDVPSGDALPLTRSVAAAIEPVRLQQTLGAFGFTRADKLEKFAAWQRRHVT